MNTITKLFCVKNNQRKDVDPMPEEQRSAYDRENILLPEPREKSLSFEELSKRHPGRFIDANAEIESKGITAFLLPGMGMKASQLEEPDKNEATKEDWDEFSRNEEGLTRIVLEHIRRMDSKR